jgi:predicted kinase
MANLYILAGCPACGKSTWAHEHNTDCNAKVISRDNIRFTYIANDPDFLPSIDYFKYEKNVIRDFYNQINDNLCNDINVIADATHISWKSLCKTVENCGKNANKIILVYFNRGLDIALPQNAKRGGVERVPEDVIKRMWAGRYMPARAKAAGLVDEYMIV